MDKWEEHMKILDEVFFTDDDIIQRNTSGYREFLIFLERYERFKSRTISNSPSTVPTDNHFMFPSKFNKRYKVNFALSHSLIKERYKTAIRHRSDKHDVKKKFPIEDVFAFKQILIYYYDFLQKQKLQKVLKIKRDQSNLPIKQYEEEIINTVRHHQKVIIAGDTGCGKSTQVPQYLLSAGFTKIACTQPRRIACISLAKRVSFETLSEYMADIAYQVRFESSKNKVTKVLFLTEGLLLRQFQSDPTLSMYNIIVVDEVHERHINGDFLLGVLKCLLEQRKDLKLILMSATINIELFTSYFKDAHVIQVPGRLYPIDMHCLSHCVEGSSEDSRFDPSPYLKVMQLIDKKYPSSERGDLLVFMSGMAEISAVVESAKEYSMKSKSWIVLPLHSSLSIEDQDKIFDIAPEGVRKCIVSTNIAETSITIDGVRFIADSGKVKEMTYDAQFKMKRLQEFWISQASAEQRKGRAGRTGPGVCFRLYSQEDYNAFAEYSTPEIHRLPLDTLVLQMASLGLHDATRFPFLESPEKSNIVNAAYFLREQNAVTNEGKLTPLGNMLSRLPVDIVIGKMLIMGSLFDLVDPILIIAAALSVQSPLTKKFGSESDFDVEQRRKEFYSPHGDPFTLLRAYDEWILVKADRSMSSKKWCKRRGFEEQRFYEMSKLKRQFEDLLKDHSLLRKMTERKSYTERAIDSELRKLKRDNASSQLRKRKILKLDNLQSNEDNEEDNKTDVFDIHDIDFKLRHNLSKLEESSKRNRRFSYREINLLKLIISSGLYPQFVIPDESNIHRKQSEQMFHSKDKQFLMLHPIGVYYLQPEFLESLYESNQKNEKESTAQRSNCSRELLIYVSLLETNKPYVVNTMKVQALQTLFLLSSSIDTNTECNRFVFNKWIELTFTKDYNGQDLLSNVVQLRTAWDKLLNEKLAIHENSDDQAKISTTARKIRKLEGIVSLKLAEFIDADIKYKLRRVTSGELKYLYVNSLNTIPIIPSTIESDNNSLNTLLIPTSNTVTKDLASDTFAKDLASNTVIKGGTEMTQYVRYGCLRDETSVSIASGEAEYLRQHYHCPNCAQHLICTVLERIKHDEICGIESIEVETSVELEREANVEAEADISSTTNKPTTETYYCNDCVKEFEFTKTEILKHKLVHR